MTFHGKETFHGNSNFGPRILGMSALSLIRTGHLSLQLLTGK